MTTPSVENAIRAIADAHSGRLTPDLVVEAARSKDSPLHSYFTWDVKKAANECWLYQARRLIRSVRVEVSTTQFDVRVPAYLRDPGAANDAQGYVSLGRLRTDDDLAREACVYEFGRASAALARAKAVATALGLDGEIEEVRGRIEQLSERANQAVATA